MGPEEADDTGASAASWAPGEMGRLRRVDSSEGDLGSGVTVTLRGSDPGDLASSVTVKYKVIHYIPVQYLLLVHSQISVMVSYYYGCSFSMWCLNI